MICEVFDLQELKLKTKIKLNFRQLCRVFWPKHSANLGAECHHFDFFFILNLGPNQDYAVCQNLGSRPTSPLRRVPRARGAR